MNELNHALVKLTIAFQEAELSIRQFADTYKAYQDRVHPIVRFVWWLFGK